MKRLLSGWTLRTGRFGTARPAGSAEALRPPPAADARCGWVLTRLRRSRQLPDQAAGRLTEFLQEFAAHSARTEPQFVGLGGQLQQLHSAASELASLVRYRTESLRGALLQSRVAGTDGLAARSLRELRATLEETSRLLQSLRTVGEALQRFHTQAEGIQRISVFLSAAAVSFAVESARTPECQEAFGAFVGELKSLAGRIAELGEAIDQEAHATHATHVQGFEAMSAGWETMRRLAAQLEQQSQATATEAQALLDASWAALEEATDCARQIAQHADTAVYHLQFGDIVRQKTEHIVAALQDAADSLAQPTDRAEAQAKCQATQSVVAVQLSQLESVRQEIVTAHTTLGAAFEGLGAQTDRLAQALHLGSGTLPEREAGADPLQVLLRDAQEVERLHDQGCQLGQQVQETAHRVVEASARLAQHLDQVKTINHEMHLQALNAIIKTAALGAQGATLEILSMEVDRLFRNSNEVVTGIIRSLEEIRSEAQLTAQAQGTTVATNAAGEESGSLRTGLEQISAAYGQFRETTAQARALAQSQQALLAESGQELEFLQQLATSFAQQSETLGTVRQLLASSSAGPASVTAAEVNSLTQRYTMQSELEIHRRVLAGEGHAAEAGAAPGAPASLPAGATPSESRPDAGAPSTAAGRDAGAPGEAEAPLQPEPAPAAANAFGDNVELF